MALRRAWAFDSPRCGRSTSPIWRPTGSTGLSEVIGSWKIMAMSRPRRSGSGGTVPECASSDTRVSVIKIVSGNSNDALRSRHLTPAFTASDF
jgi:hypothetical protein